MSPHRKITRYLGIRGRRLLLCAVIWGHIGLGVVLEPNSWPSVYLYEHLPMWVRVVGWCITGALAAWAAARKTHVAVAVAGLILMPLELLGSLLWGAVVYAPRGARRVGQRLVLGRLVPVPGRSRGHHRA